MEFEHHRPVAHEVLLECERIALKRCFQMSFADQTARQPLMRQQIRVHPHDENFFIIGTIENTDTDRAAAKLIAARQKKIVLQFLLARRLEAVHLASLRIDRRTSRA